MLGADPLVAEDLDGDGVVDLVGVVSGSVRVALGLGSARYAPSVEVPTPISRVRAIALGDLTGDGAADLVVVPFSTDLTGSAIHVLHGRGDGTFEPSSYAARGPPSPHFPVLHDLDQDGNLDLLVRRAYYPRYIAMLPGRGGGVFGDEVALPVDGRFFVAGDWNGDTKPDLVVADGSASVALLPGNGDGTFGEVVRKPISGDSRSVALADLDGDGWNDVLVSGLDLVTIFLNQGAGMFERSEVEGGIGRVADLDGDGWPDFVFDKDDALHVLKGMGDGTFQPGGTFPAAGNTPVIADLDNDDDLDIATADSFNPVSILQNNGDATFGAARAVTAGTWPSDLEFVDLNGDTHPDLVVSNEMSHSVSVLLGVPGGSFASPVDYPTANFPMSIESGDLNGDGHIDLVAPCQLEVTILLGRGDGVFDPGGTIRPPNRPRELVVADFDADGNLDLVLNHGYITAVIADAPQSVFLYRGRGDGTFEAPVARPTGRGPYRAHVADVDADGRPDLLLNHYYDNLGVLFGQADGQPGAPVDLGFGGALLAVGDVNADGALDLATVQSRTLRVALGAGDGTFDRIVESEDTRSREPERFADLDRDGNLDLVLLEYASSSFAVRRGRGDGTFEAAVSFGSGRTPRAARVVDLDGDGKLEVGVVNLFGNTISLHSEICIPTPIAVLEWQAQWSERGVHLSWMLSGDDLGSVRRVQVQRADAADGPYADVSRPLRAAKSMSFVDAGVNATLTYWYRLELQFHAGHRTFVGPLSTASQRLETGTALLTPILRSDGSIALRYRIDATGAGPLHLAVYDARGRLVRTLTREHHGAGAYVEIWDGRNAAGVRAARGIYIVRLRSRDSAATRKIPLLIAQ